MTTLQITADAARTVFTANDQSRMIGLLIEARTSISIKRGAIERAILDAPRPSPNPFDFLGTAGHDAVLADPTIKMLNDACARTQAAIDTLAAIDTMSLPFVRA